MAARPSCIVRSLALIVALLCVQGRDAWCSDASPIRNFALTAERVRTFGQYALLHEAALRPGDALHLYGEPGSFGWHDKNGRAHFNISVGGHLRRSDGRRLASSIPSLSLAHTAANRPDKFFFSLALNIRAPRGSYIARVRLRDTVTGRTVEKDFPFTIGQKQPQRSETTAAAPQAATTIAAEQSPKADCKRYFPQIGAMIPVPCEP